MNGIVAPPVLSSLLRGMESLQEAPKEIQYHLCDRQYNALSFSPQIQTGGG